VLVRVHAYGVWLRDTPLETMASFMLKCAAVVDGMSKGSEKMGAARSNLMRLVVFS